MHSVFVRDKHQLQIVGLAVLLSAMTGCENSTIVGKWNMSGGSDATDWEFSENGSVLIGEVRGKYVFGDQKRVKIETPFATSVYQLEIVGDRMTLRKPDGSKLEFTRSREAQQ